MEARDSLSVDAMVTARSQTASAGRLVFCVTVDAMVAVSRAKTVRSNVSALHRNVTVSRRNVTVTRRNVTAGTVTLQKN